MITSEIVDRCRELATRLHGRDTPPREDSGLPYITHPARVVELLTQWGYDDDPLVLALGWTHDLKEDTRVTDEEIIAAGMELGDELLQMVNDLTFKDDPQDHDNAKARYIEQVAAIGGAQLAVKIADRLSNSLERAENDPRRAWSYFNKGSALFERGASLRHSKAILAAIEKVRATLVGKQ